MTNHYYRILLLILLIPLQALANDTQLCHDETPRDQVYYVSVDGHDYKGRGTYDNPWRNIAFAVYKAKDNSLIIAKSGVYDGPVKISKTFTKGLTIKAETPYLSKLQANSRVLALVKSAANITIEGFEISHIDKDSKPVVVHIDAWGEDKVRDIKILNNIIHDSYNNDLLKVNYGAENITIGCNIFYNQGDSDEHIDINSTNNVVVRDNVFFNDFPKSNREITKKSSSYVVIKDSNDNSDRFKGSTNITVKRNVFLNWQGTHGHGFILIGEDGKPYYEASNVNIYNNLMLGNSAISMRSPLGVKGSHNIKFYNNTVSGNLPSNAYAIRANKERGNLIPDNIILKNNIWSDDTGTMGMGEYESSTDFSDTLFYDLETYTMNNNLIYNGGEDLPSSLLDKITPSSDDNLTTSNPGLAKNESVITPVWSLQQQKFSDGSTSIREVFKRLVLDYGVPTNNKVVTSDLNQGFPKTDILNTERKGKYVLGAYQVE